MKPIIDLAGRTGLVAGIANADSIAWGCARAFTHAGAELAVTYLNGKAEPFVRPLAESIRAPLILPMDVAVPAQVDAVFQEITRCWGRLDFVLHSIASAPKADLHGRLTDCSAEGFAAALTVSVHSFIDFARRAEPLMQRGGCLLTVTYAGSQRVVPHYNFMGPIKAALESATKYLAAELGALRIRVHALSPGPMHTRAASGIAQFDELVDRATAQAPEHLLADIDDVGGLAAFLVSDAARHITGTIIPVDGGQHVMA